MEEDDKRNPVCIGDMWETLQVWELVASAIGDAHVSTICGVLDGQLSSMFLSTGRAIQLLGMAGIAMLSVMSALVLATFTDFCADKVVQENPLCFNFRPLARPARACREVTFVLKGMLVCFFACVGRLHRISQRSIGVPHWPRTRQVEFLCESARCLQVLVKLPYRRAAVSTVDCFFFFVSYSFLLAEFPCVVVPAEVCVL